MTRILGIDPGLCHCGWGIIENEKWVDHGVIEPPVKSGIHKRLGFLFEYTKMLIEHYQPDEVGIEQILVNKNPTASIQLAMARGALLAATSHLKVYEYAPTTIKKALTGSGQADKQQIMIMIQRFIAPQKPLQPDSADALAIALCHARSRLWLEQQYVSYL